MNKQTLIKILHALKYVFGPALLAFVIWSNWNVVDKQTEQQVGISRIFNPNYAVHWVPLTAAFALSGVCMLFTFIRWYVLVRAQDLPFTVANAVRLGMVGSFFNLILPFSVGGDLAKIFHLVREQSRRTVAVATIVMDRVVGLCGLIWLTALLGGIFVGSGALQTMVTVPEARWKLELIVQISWILVAGSVTFWFLLGFMPLATTTHWIARIERIPKVGHAMAELCRAALMYRSRSRAVLLSLLIAMAGHVGFVLTFYFCSLAVNPVDNVPSLATHFLIQPVGAVFAAVFPTPNGMGGREWAFGELYAQVGGVNSEGVFASLTRATLIDVLLGIVGFFIYWRMKPALHAVEAEQKADLATCEAGLPTDQLQPVHPG